MKWFWFLLLALPCVFGATIHGTVYDFELTKLSNAIVEINTSPRQVFVAVNGVYSFSVPPGDYVLKAKLKDSEIVENVSAISEGDYVFDLILLPEIDDVLFEDIPEPPRFEDIIEDRPSSEWAVWILVFIIIILIIYFFVRGKKEVVKERVVVADELQQILDFIDSQEGRTTQKDIRKKFPYSEAKISLMIDDLEAKGCVKKIKKGRGNIVTKV